MSKKTLPQDIDLDSLLSTIQEESSVLAKEASLTNDNVLEFISFYNIKKGDIPIKKSMVYKLYKSWSNNKNYSKYSFMLQMNQYFITNNMCYMLDIEAIDLTLKAKDTFFKSKVTSKIHNASVKKQIDIFMETFGIVKGKYSTHVSILYYMYSNWPNKKHRLNINDFKLLLSFVLDSHIDNEFLYSHPEHFYIDKPTLKVDGVTLEEAKAWAKTQTKKNKSKKSSED